jgi:hypothetical protein
VAQKDITMKSNLTATIMSVLALVICYPNLPASADYLLINPPPDSDKPGGQGTDNSCWMHVASNMLAAAGYGNGATMQGRADDIFANMQAHYGILDGGWSDVAMQWWLQSSHNTWPNNPYRNVTFTGQKGYGIPWLNQNAPQTLGNELRESHLVGPNLYDGGGIYHAITAWGDDATAAPLNNNPAQLLVTDSDRDFGGDVQRYSYDAFSTTDGWRFDFANPHTHLQGFSILSPVDIVTDRLDTQLIFGSYRIHQNDRERNATDLHYEVGTDTDILMYRTEIDWPRPNFAPPPTITEDQNPPQNLTVSWDMPEDPVPFSNDVTITTRFVVPTFNYMEHRQVRWTYDGDPGAMFPEFAWNITTLQRTDPNDVPAEYATGGFVNAAFDLCSDELCNDVIGAYRLQHEYDYYQDPEQHTFELTSLQEEGGPFYAGNFRFGHSYGLLDESELWTLENWMMEDQNVLPLEPNVPIPFALDWNGLLPYPSGVLPLPLRGDFNRDGVLTSTDIDDLTSQSASGMNSTEYDLNADAIVNQADVTVWIRDVFGSWVGDSDLNREFNSSDLVIVLASGKYESGTPSVWTEGDFNGSGLTDSGDLVAALADGGYEAGPRAATAAVPEPASAVLISFGMMSCVVRRRRRAS